MKIAILGWGSLIWNPGNLEIDKTIGKKGWFDDGPILPIEFARVSGNRRLTLVISTKYGTLIPTLYAVSNFECLDQAICDLFRREGCEKVTSIGYFIKKNYEFHSSFKINRIIEEWLIRKVNIDAVIWTDLPTNFKKKTGYKFSRENVISYLNNLSQEQKNEAEEYIRKAPAFVKTPIRKAIEAEIGWTRFEDDYE